MMKLRRMKLRRTKKVFQFWGTPCSMTDLVTNHYHLLFCRAIGVPAVAAIMCGVNSQRAFCPLGCTQCHNVGMLPSG